MRPRRAVLAALVALSACAPQMSNLRLEQSAALIRSAEEEGAAQLPEAKVHLQLARDERDDAWALARRSDPRWLLMLTRSDLDAELAVALVRQARTGAKDSGATSCER